jgi:SpoVK/Ycf46/Vps4 family AAA+-type ATPase
MMNAQRLPSFADGNARDAAPCFLSMPASGWVSVAYADAAAGCPHASNVVSLFTLTQTPSIVAPPEQQTAHHDLHHDTGGGCSSCEADPVWDTLHALVVLLPQQPLPSFALPRSFLLYGPPGTGKTRLVERIALAARRAVVAVEPGDLMSQWVGASEKRLSAYFHTARALAPSILFFDEADALFGTRGAANESEVLRRVKTQILMAMNALWSTGRQRGPRGASGDEDDDRHEAPADVLVFAATNLPWELDAAVCRRFEEHIYVGLPLLEARQELVRVHMRPTEDSSLHRPQPRRELRYSAEALHSFASALDGCSASEVLDATRTALRAPLLSSVRSHKRGAPEGHAAAAVHHPVMLLSTTELVGIAKRQRRCASVDDIARFTNWGNSQ